MVDVAAPIDSIPFWLADRGFRETDLSLVNPDTRWKVYQKSFDRGSIGLGVNGLDRSPAAHYVVFVRPIRGTGTSPPPGTPVVTLEEDHWPSWRAVVAGHGVSASFDAWKPFATIPAELAGAVMLQPSHAGRHSSLLATGRVWKTHVDFGAPTRPGGHLLRRGPRHGAGLDLEDVAGSRVDGGADHHPADGEDRASWRATRPASKSRVCSTIRSSGGIGWP